MKNSIFFLSEKRVESEPMSRMGKNKLKTVFKVMLFNKNLREGAIKDLQRHNVVLSQFKFQ